MKAYFLMKAHKATEAKVGDISKWEWSVKLDGIRAFWDGGCTLGRTDVPWAMGQVSTGLWTINGKVIHAPIWWLATLPAYPADCELWAGPRKYQQVTSTCRKKVPIDDEWRHIVLVHHTRISFEEFTSTRIITEPHINVNVSQDLWLYYLREAYKASTHEQIPGMNFFIPAKWNECTTWNALISEILPDLVDTGHEGVMLRRKGADWEPHRSWNLLKLKPFKDAEAKVIGVKAGKNKHLGKAGSLKVVWNNKVFYIGNLFDGERTLIALSDSVDPTAVAADLAGEDLPGSIMCLAYTSGTTVTFKYRELTDGGIPKDPRLWRKT